MAFLEWTEKYATHVPEMDKHHQHLFDLINALHDDMLACQSLEEEQNLTKALLAELADYVNYHFSEEERLMEAWCFPARIEHRFAHQFYRNRLAELNDTFTENPIAMSFDTFRFLRDWIAEHVLIRDAEYTPYVK